MLIVMICSGCSAVVLRSPKRPLSQPTRCYVILPVGDLVVGVSSIAFVTAADSLFGRSGGQALGPFAAVGALGGLLFAISAAHGFSTVSDCRTANQQYDVPSQGPQPEP